MIQAHRPPTAREPLTPGAASTSRVPPLIDRTGAKLPKKDSITPSLNQTLGKYSGFLQRN